MPPHPDHADAPQTREQGKARLRTLTRVALLATTGATVAIGIVVAHEHPGASATGKSSGGSSSGTTASSGSSGSTGSTGTTGSTGNTGSVSTGNTGSSSFSPSISSSRPSVTSGGTSR